MFSFVFVELRSILTQLTQNSLFGLLSAWCAPEALTDTGQGKVAGYKTDVYMIGSFMFELITGRIPYFWVNPDLVLQLRSNALATGSTENVFQEAVRLGLFRHVLTNERLGDNGASMCCARSGCCYCVCEQSFQNLQCIITMSHARRKLKLSEVC